MTAFLAEFIDTLGLETLLDECNAALRMLLLLVAAAIVGGLLAVLHATPAASDAATPRASAPHALSPEAGQRTPLSDDDMGAEIL